MQLQGPRFVSLCDRIVLVTWSLPERVDGPCTLAGTFGESIAPVSSLRLVETGGGTRLVWALPRPAEESCVLLAAAGGAGSTPVEFKAAELDQVDSGLLDGLTPEARLQLSWAILGSWPNLFRLGRNVSFIAALRALFRAPQSPSEAIHAVIAAGTSVIVEVATPRRFGSLKSGYLVYPDRVRPLGLIAMSIRQADRANSIRRFFADVPADDQPSFVVLRGDNGLLVRDWPRRETAAQLETWWRKNEGRDVGLREECLALLNAQSAATRAASIEFQLRCPLKTRAVSGSSELPGARIDLALTGSKGLLVGGWYRDPAGFVAGFDVLDHNNVAHALDARIDFAGKVAGPGEAQLDAHGFVSLVPAIKGPLQQPRFLLRLKSGVRHLLVPPVQPIDWPAARAAALRAVPQQVLSEHVISSCLAPMLQEYQEAAKFSIGAPLVKRIGAPVENPLVSIIIPLYRVLEFLPFQIAAFASDPQILFRCELIYILDSPEQADVVEHLLTGLHLVYGIPITLAVMSRNGGFSIANNRAVSLARGNVLALVNSDVIPIEGGWVGALEQRLGSSAVGAVGPKLLYEDDSIQHAGLFFAQDHRGRWLNQHYFKGMPRHYRPAAIERSVPGITGACMVMKRELFEQVGGFTEDYVIGDYEDSDLCLKIRHQGKDIVYAPDAELYHLERRSMSQNADYMRGAASQYNAWLHQQRWGDAMSTLMAQYKALSLPRLDKVA